MTSSNAHKPRRALVGVFVFCLWTLHIASGCGGKKFELTEGQAAFAEAKKAIEDGDTATAITCLDRAIDAEPDTWSYFERAKLHAESGDDDLAKADIAAGLEMDPEHSDLLWLQKQMKKSKNARFKGKSGQPPQASK